MGSLTSSHLGDFPQALRIIATKTTHFAKQKSWEMAIQIFVGYVYKLV